MHRLIAVALMSLSPCLVFANEPSFDCTKAVSGAEKLVCDTPELAALDVQLADRFAQALKAVRALDSGADAAERELKAMQRGWIGGRDECWKAQDEVGCIRDAYLMRDAELIALWMLEDPSSTTFWTCDSNPANEVVTVFFDTALPSVRFERGDTVDVGVLTPTASGARYDGSFGRYIWMKGKEATYRDPDPGGTEVSCIAAN